MTALRSIMTRSLTRLLRRALRGVAASFPEIGFVPIRKGSYPVAVPLRDPDRSRGTRLGQAAGARE